MPNKRKWSHEDFLKAVKSSNSIREILKKINLKPTGGNYKSIYSYASANQIDLSHLLGQGWRKGSNKPVIKPKNINHYLVKNSYYNSNKLRKRLIKESFFEEKCSSCKKSKWMNQKIPLELDHINGINTDNRISNLRLLCPNCHALTNTYRGKNIKQGLVSK